MINITIDNNNILIPSGTTILQAAAQLEIRIPTMCFNDAVSNHASCMVCVVKNNNTNEFIPSCATKVTEGMNISTTDSDVIEARKDALELLLSDHRGDCEAPCQRACPADKNIPLLNRIIAKNELENSSSLLSTYSLSCVNCTAPCEKVCRRKQVDRSLSIREVLILLEDRMQLKSSESNQQPKTKEKNKFNSTYGRLTDQDFEGMLADAENCEKTEINTLPFSLQSAVDEAKRCMHCDCRKNSSCKLKVYSNEYNASQSKYRLGNNKKVCKIVQQNVLVYEPEKCIKCGLCVAVLKQNKNLVGLAFIGRGFDIHIDIPFSKSLEDAINKGAARCIEVCPTGALANYKGEDVSN